MATQDHTHIPFFYSTPQAPIRLIELPPALLSLIESDSPPMCVGPSFSCSCPSAFEISTLADYFLHTCSLKLKSTPPSSTSGGHAVLCTPSETFSIRQVQTSNSIYLLQPHVPTPATPPPDLDTFPEIPLPGLTIVSTATSYLELLPSTPSPVPHLYQTLPVYHGWDTDESNDESGMETESPASEGYASLLEHAAVSDGEFLRAWTDTGGFELSKVPHRPSAAVSLQLLNKISVASTISAISLTNSSKPFTTFTIWNAIDEDSLPIPLLESFLRRVCDPTQGTWGGDVGWVMSESRLASCIGRLLLETDYDERKLIPKSSVKATEYTSLPGFLKKWRETLVDKNIECDVNLDMIKGWYYQPTALTISWLAPGFVPPAEVGSVADADVAPPALAGSSRGRGKWHEKFAARKRKVGS